jgi:hypothetical protein
MILAGGASPSPQLNHRYPVKFAIVFLGFLVLRIIGRPADYTYSLLAWYPYAEYIRKNISN